MLDLIQKAHVTLKTFKRDEDGAALVEYGVILLVALAVGIGGLTLLGDEINATFGRVIDFLQDEVNADP